MKKIFFIPFTLLVALFLGACASNLVEPDGGSSMYEGEDGGIGNGSGGGNEQGRAGVVTAGEWRDLDNWLFWSNLMTTSQPDQTGADYTAMSDYWKLYTNNRVAVRVTDENGAPQKDVPVTLQSHPAEGNPQTLFAARTDNRGEVNLWIGLTQRQQAIDTSAIDLVVNNTIAGHPAVTHWGDEVKWNICTAAKSATANIDIAFIVDATGSMYDEIAFLKADLTNIIDSVGGCHADANIRTAALFYRDEGDDYLTRVSDFSTDLSVTTAFIEEQTADGGGDYPEAVHTALSVGLQKLSWREDNCMRLAFMLLDAPPHHENMVIESIQQSIPLYARTGIRIIPVAASGVDKNTEFFLRFIAIATDGTYVFITDDSGIGGEHLVATVGEYKVELLNALIVRLINQYME